MKWRFYALQLFFVVLVVIILLRLTYWQIIAAPGLKSQAQFQRLTSILLPSRRGEIISSDTFPLVTNQDSYLLYANPQQFTDFQSLTSLLSSSTSAALVAKLSGTKAFWIALAHNLSPQLKDQIDQAKLPGIGFEPEPQRFYPDASVSAHLLGFVGQDENGLPKGYFGLEGYYDRHLSGRPGKLLQEQDALSRPIVIGTQNRLPSQDGQELSTSIDRTLQFISYQKLANALTRYGASAGTVTIMDPQSGQILAMVSLPNYDPVSYWDYPPQSYSNPVISNTYEPGSTFKVVVMSAALDSHVLSPDTICNICSGPVSVSNYSIRTWNDKYFPQSTMTEVIQHSDNVGMVFASRLLGKNKMIDYLKRFGFGSPTGVDLQEEGSAPLRPDKEWGDIDLATTSFGQGIAITPLQMLRAVSAIANKGRLTTPRVAQDKSTSQGGTKQIISPATAAQMTQMMINSVDKGEAKWAKPSGFIIAGKTGTAQIPVAGHYDAQKTIASFVGFAPAYAPRFVMLVTLQEPQTSPWGSETAAPLWFDIAKEIFRYWKISPQ